MRIIEYLSTLLTGNEAWLWAIVPLACMAYMAPLLIAFERHHRFAWTIGAINLATGWTLVGWLAAMIWAVNKDVRETAAAMPASIAGSFLEPRWSDATVSDQSATGGETKKCPYCAEHIKAEAIVCRFCSRDLVLSGRPAQAMRPSTDLESDEKRRLESLLAEDDKAETKDPSLLEVFEYMRLLEENDPLVTANVISMAPEETADEPNDEADREAAKALGEESEEWDYPEPAASIRR